MLWLGDQEDGELVLVVDGGWCMKRKRALPKKEVEEGDKTSGYNSTEKKIMMMMMGGGYNSIPSLFVFQGPDSRSTVQMCSMLEREARGGRVEGARLDEEEETVKRE